MTLVHVEVENDRIDGDFGDSGEPCAWLWDAARKAEAAPGSYKGQIPLGE